MDYLTTRGLVLRTTEYKETDRILTVLSADRGLLTMKARGVRSNRSKLKGACQLLTYAEFTVGEAHGFSSITEATALEMFPELRTDIELLALASYFAQLAEVLSQEDAASPALLPLILNALYALAKLKKPPRLVKAATELRLAALAGYLPELSGCCVCGNAEPDRFSIADGTLCRRSLSSSSRRSSSRGRRSCGLPPLRAICRSFPAAVCAAIRSLTGFPSPTGRLSARPAARPTVCACRSHPRRWLRCAISFPARIKSCFPSR